MLHVWKSIQLMYTRVVAPQSRFAPCSNLAPHVLSRYAPTGSHYATKGYPATIVSLQSKMVTCPANTCQLDVQITTAPVPVINTLALWH